MTNAFGGQAPLGPAERASALPKPSSYTRGRGPTSKGKGRERKEEGKEREGSGGGKG